MAEKKPTKSVPSRPDAGSGSPMDVSLLEQIVRLMADHDLNTVDVRDGARRVILKRGPAFIAGAPAVAAAIGPISASAAEAARAGSSAPGAGASGPGASSDEDVNLVPIRSPMVGTFYTASKPGEKPYVTVGSKVVKDETDVCQIEAMKNFFVQKADVSGTIVKVLIENGHPVQAEQPMFMVKSA